ncbi:hypothetical protein FA743_18225 [Paracoccus gahaiensis]|uniref:Sulfotransferase domain-containing protein n=1 Tax=Paracoccus gahaiensis TaxID=1706839 RepID=A0A4U0RNB6_9RHOB|nr:hypothetical protein FA743_18225 [Paracoccus gahaiensis]
MNYNASHLVLHIGQTKAGSTAIQNYLDSQRNELLRHNILVPDLSLSRSNPFDLERTSGHLKLIRSLARNTKQTDLQLKELSTHKRVVLSAENIFHDRPDKEIAEIANFFCNYEITLVLIVRSTESWLKSRYIENIMSGFKACSSTFEEFLQISISGGVHDYASRLDSIVTALGAKHIRVINYDAELNKCGIIPAFLKAADLPVTDFSRANTIRSNVRESHAFLIEAKRKLNYLTKNISLTLRLELEHKVRFLARKIVKEMKVSPAAWSQPISFTSKVYNEIINSNKRLIEEFKLHPSLPDPKHKKIIYMPDHHDKIPAEKLITNGLKTAATLLKNNSQRQLASPSISLLNLNGIEAVIEIIFHSTVSFHLSSETALWAALYEKRFPFLISSRNNIKKINEASSFVISSKILDCRDLKNINDSSKYFSPGIFIVPPDISTSRIISVLNRLPNISKLILSGYGSKKACNVSNQVKCTIYKQIGGVHVLNL